MEDECVERQEAWRVLLLHPMGTQDYGHNLHTWDFSFNFNPVRSAKTEKSSHRTLELN